MNKKLEINIGKKPDIVFQFDQFLNVEQAVDKFLNKKSNLEKLIAPLMPQGVEDTIKKIMPKDGETPSDEKLLELIKPLIPKVENGYTPKKGIDYFDGEDGETPTDEKIISLIKPLIPPVQKVKDGVTPKKGIDYFTKQELQDIKKAIKESILSEIPKTLSKDELTVKFQTIQNILNNMPIRGASYLRQLMDVKMGTLDDLQYGFTYNKSTAQFTLTQITGGGGGSVDSVNGQTGVVVLDQDDIGDGTTYKQYSATEKTKLAGIETGAEVNTIDTVSDTTEIDLAITARDLTATIRAGSIDESKLDTSVNASLDKADTAVQPSDLTPYELLSNKSTSTSLGTSDTLYPTQNAVKTYADNLVAGLLDYRGGYDASGNVFPSSGGSGTAGAVLKGDMWIISVAGTLGGTAVQIGDSVIANVDTPGQTASNWNILNANISYVPEDVANKENTTINTSTTKYPTVNLLKTGLDTKAPIDNPTFTTRINVPEIKATGSGGVDVHNNAGTQVAIFGAGGSTGSTLVGTTNIGSASADYHQVAGGSGTITDTATGSSTNINVNIVPKGTGRLQSGGVTVPTISSTDTLTNKSIDLASNTLTGTKAQFNTAVSDGNIVYEGAMTTSGLTMATAKILGRSTASTGAIEEISVGSGLTLSGGTLSASGSSPSTKCYISSNFETAARFTQTDTGTFPSVTFDNTGASLTTSNSAEGSTKITWSTGGNGMLLFANSPKFTAVVTMGNLGWPSPTTTGSLYCGIGDITVSNTAHTFTNRHIGFKVLYSGGNHTLFATQADGTTENASSALTTVVSSDILELVFIVNSTTSVDYYWRKNGGSLSSVTTLTGNVPTGSTNGNAFQWSTQNGADATRYGIVANHFTYER